MSLPDHFFDEHNRPRWNVLNARFGSPIIIWNQVIGGVPKDEDVVYQPTESIAIGEELQKLREVVESLEQKFVGVR